MSKKIKILLIPHVHWDREWFKTEETFNVVLNRQFDDLDKFNHNYNFDGHTWALDDYLRNNSISDNVKKNMKSGKIKIGPLYVQSDFYNSSFGTLETNLRIGKKITKQYGKIDDLMYIADSFGYHEQMPQIFNKHGFKKFVFWRGIKPSDRNISNIFYWKGIAKNSKLLCSAMAPYGNSINDDYFSTGYSLKYPYNVEEKDFDNELIKLKNLYHDYISQKKEWQKLDQYWIPVGHDWAPVPLSIDKVVEWLNKNDDKYEYNIGTYEDYFKSIKISGEIPALKYSNLNYSGTSKIHRTIASNRYDIKKTFREAELKLFYRMEQLEIMYKQMGGKLFSEEWKENEIYKKLLAASAHDSLGGCNTDETNNNALLRINGVKNTIESYCDLMLRDIKENIRLKDDEYLIINTAPFKQDLLYFDKISTNSNDGLFCETGNVSITTYNIKDRSHKWGDCPKTFDLDIAISAKNMSPFSFRVVKLKKHDKLNFVKLDVPDEKLSVTVKNKKIDFSLRLEDDFGDEFDFSTNESATHKLTSHATEISYVVLGDLRVKKFKILSTFKGVETIFNVTELNDNNKYKFKIITNNNLSNSRISLEFNEPKATLSRSLAFIDQGFDDIKDFLSQKYKDFPANNYTNDGLVRFEETDINIYTSGTNEVELKDEKVRIIMARFPDTIGRPNLDYRPGVPSGPRHLVKTKGSLLHKDLVFDFGIDTGNPVKGLNEWLFNGYGKQGNQINKLNNKTDYLEINPANLNVSANISFDKINHNDYLIGIYRINEKEKISFGVSNPLSKKTKDLNEFEIKYKNILET